MVKLTFFYNERKLKISTYVLFDTITYIMYLLSDDKIIKNRFG